MKKTLVALAALASVSAFAQVTITGNLDFAGARFGGTMYGNKGITTITTGNGTSSTSSINFTATEDIGGGTKVTAFYGLDPRTFSNDSTTSTMGPGSAALSPNTVVVTGITRHEAYVQASGGFGSIKIGAPNAVGLNVVGGSTGMGTGVGSGYGAHSNTQISRIAPARYSRSARYDSPAIAPGLTASVTYAPGADQAVIDAAGNAYGAFQAPNARKVTEIGLFYSNGPMNLAYFNQSQSAMTNLPGYYAISDTSSGTATYGATKYNFASANYKIGDTTIYAGMGNGQEVQTYAAAGSLYKNKASRYGFKQTMGQLDILVTATKNVRTLESGTTNINEQTTGFQAVYNLSKTSAAYLGYEKWDTGATATTSTTTTGIRNITSLGLRKSF